MATYKHIRSSTANKRPTTSIADGQLAINTNTASPGLFFKDSAGTGIVKVGPVHVGTTAPNASPASGGSSGNYTGEQWLDTSLTPAQLKVWNGSTWIGVVADELPVSKLQDGVARQLIQTDAAGTGVEWTSDIDLPGTLDVTGAATLDSTLAVAGNVTLGTSATLTFEGATDDGFETTVTVVDPTADRTITLPNVSGTVITTGDTGTVTSTMLADGTIVNADVNASAAIAGTKISPDFGNQNVTTTGTATAASLIPSSSTVPTNGVYLPAADSVAISTNSTGRLFVDSSGRVGVATNAPGSPLDVFGGGVRSTDSAGNARSRFEVFTNGQSNNQITLGQGFGAPTDNIGYLYNRANASLVFGTNDTERMRLDSSGRLGIGTSSPGAKLDVEASNFVGGPAIGVRYNTSNVRLGFNVANLNGFTYIGSNTNNKSSSDTATYDLTGQPASQLRLDNGQLIFNNAPSGTAGNDITFTNRLTITSAGLVGIGTTSPSEAFTLGSGNAQITSGQLTVGVTSTSGLQFINDGTFGTLNSIPLILRTVSAERARIDTSGRLLVGTSSSASAGNASVARIQVVGNSADAAASSVIALNRGEAATSITSGESIGNITFGDSSGNEFGLIQCIADANAGTNDYPGRLVFSTTSDGASSPTERMRIASTGAVLIGNTTQFSITSSTATGSVFGSDGTQVTFASAQTVAYFGRQTSDGTIIEFRQDGTPEGSISVSGTTVSYNGAHLSRWSQLPSGAERTEILRGSVLSNIDEMCEWGEEDNEQLNRMKVSDVEGDKNVSGVFQAWDDDDDTYTNDFYCAMTGDFIIRIGVGVTVERGDLLMSAGDGTAKPQDDDIIRSKTIAKVTSTNVTCTYEDGSYCVPCVLMAC